MKVALLQTTLIWENAEANRSHIEAQIDSIPEAVDLIVLPEMFSTGFTMVPQAVAEPMSGMTVSWLKSTAKAKQAAIVGSLVIEEANRYYNRLVFVFPSGKVKTYDKKHLFTLAGEDKVYASGNDRLTLTCNGFKICPLICYDLRFPVFSRNTEDYDLLLYVANWPKPRVGAWDALLKARAIENQCFVIGVNRIGTDENKHEYVGHSQVVDCFGNYVLEPSENSGVFVVNLEKNEMLEARKKFDFLSDRDSFTISN